MFNDDKWDILGTLAMAGCAFFVGRKLGENKIVERYESQHIINQQQQQINMLNDKINKMEQKQLQ